jgi:hypothetical protein
MDLFRHWTSFTIFWAGKFVFFVVLCQKNLAQFLFLRLFMKHISFIFPLVQPKVSPITKRLATDSSRQQQGTKLLVANLNDSVYETDIEVGSFVSL